MARLPTPPDIGGPAIPPPGQAVDAVPIVVTAMMGAAEWRYFNALRTAHYPPDRNQVAAHITLFRHVPPSCLGELDRLVKVIVADPSPPAWIAAPFTLGNGTAFRIDSPALLAIRDRIAEWFAPMLTAQDQAQPQLHVTVQNKVDRRAADALLGELRADFVPRSLSIIGIAAHHYRGGPWELAFERKFRG